MFAWRSFGVQPLTFPHFLLKNMNCASEAEESHSFMENLNHREKQLAMQAACLSRATATVLLLSAAGNIAKHSTHTVY